MSGLSALVTLLLVLGKQAAGSFSPPELHEPRLASPIPVDAMSVGEASDGEALLQIDIGQTALAFAFPRDALA